MGLGPELWRRSRSLVSLLLGEVVESELGWVPLPVLMEEGRSVLGEHGRPRWSERTVRNTVADLERFGALAVRGGKSDRRVYATTLGVAWLAGVVLPTPGVMEELSGAVELLEEEWFGEPEPVGFEDL